MTSLTFLTAVAVDPITRTKKEVHVGRTPLTNEWTDRCVMLETGSGHLAVTLHSQSTRKGRCDWTWKCKLQWRISIIVMEFFGDPIVPDGKISGTAGSSSGTAGYVRNLHQAPTSSSREFIHPHHWPFARFVLRSQPFHGTNERGAIVTDMFYLNQWVNNFNNSNNKVPNVYITFQ